MTARSRSEWWALEPRQSERELLVWPEWEGRTELGPWLLDDGRDIDRLIEGGELAELGFPIWFRQVGRDQRRGDMLGGSWCKLVSRRFLVALEELGVTDGLRTYDPVILDKRGNRIDADYVGLVEPIGTGEVRAHFPEWRTGLLTVSDRVFEGLREGGVTGFKVQPTDPANPLSD